MISDISSSPAASRRTGRGREPIQDEYTNRTDLTKGQKHRLRHGLGIFNNAERTTGLERTARLNLGLALLSVLAIPGVPLTLEDIAAWCDCSRQAIENIEARALRKLRDGLQFRDRRTWNELREHLFSDRQAAARPQLSTRDFHFYE